MGKSKVVGCGGGGFIGGHLIGDLLSKGLQVRCVDVKPQSEWYQVHPQAENVVADLNLRDKAHVAGIELKRTNNLNAPKGVDGRNSDNTLIKQPLNWEPTTKLRDGMEKTHHWIYDQMASG